MSRLTKAILFFLFISLSTTQARNLQRQPPPPSGPSPPPGGPPSTPPPPPPPPRLEDQIQRLQGFARNYDGSANNQQHTDYGQINRVLNRKGPVRYSDGIGAPFENPNARRISNVAGRENTPRPTPQPNNLTMLFTVFGQFVDHDLSLSLSASPSESFNIVIPDGDPDAYFSTIGELAFTRGAYTGGVNTPRQHTSVISPWLDGGQIYGSSNQTANSLRAFANGKMKVSQNNLLPLSETGFFQAGDIRVNENVVLTSLHTIFVRYHNRICDRMINYNNSLTDQQLYKMARNLVIGHFQRIVMEEWLPLLIGQVSPYPGYNNNLDPALDSEFTTAAFRFGHSMLWDQVELVNPDGSETTKTLEELFRNPTLFSTENQLLNRLIRGGSRTPAKRRSIGVVDEIRNLLVLTADKTFKFDLYAMNIQRGRDHGIPSYNQMRQIYGMPRLNSFADFTNDDSLQTRLQDLYGSVDNLDLWVGIIGQREPRRGDPSSALGPLGMRMVRENIERVRNADRFWYENPGVFPASVVDHIKSTSLGDIIRQVTGVNDLVGNGFVLPSA